MLPMNRVAIQRREFIVKSRSKVRDLLMLFALVAPLTLLGFFSLHSTSREPGTRKFGPTYCPDCILRTPIVDKATENILSDTQAANGLVPGDSVTVCNDTECVTYEMNDDSNWDGGNRTTITPVGGGEGPAPGGNPTSGGPAPDPRWGNIDCWTCTGTVTVGDPKKN